MEGWDVFQQIARKPAAADPVMSHRDTQDPELWAVEHKQ